MTFLEVWHITFLLCKKLAVPDTAGCSRLAVVWPGAAGPALTALFLAEPDGCGAFVRGWFISLPLSLPLPLFPPDRRLQPPSPPAPHPWPVRDRDRHHVHLPASPEAGRVRTRRARPDPAGWLS